MTRASDPGGGAFTTYAYDAAGQRTALVDPDGGRRTFTYDADGNVLTFRDPAGRITTFTYDAADRKTRTQFASGVRTGYGLDAAGQTLTLVSDNGSGTNLNWFTYTYDATGNRLTVRDLNGSVATYTYDGKGRLTRDLTTGTNAHDYAYGYDGNDNRLTSTETGALTESTYDAANRLVTSVSGGQTTTYAYNAWGALSLVVEPSGARVTQTSDLDGKLTVQSTATGATTMGYDAGGLMRYRQSSFSRVTTVWDGDAYLQERS